MPILSAHNFVVAPGTRLWDELCVIELGVNADFIFYFEAESSDIISITI